MLAPSFAAQRHMVFPPAPAAAKRFISLSLAYFDLRLSARFVLVLSLAAAAPSSFPYFLAAAHASGALFVRPPSHFNQPPPAALPSLQGRRTTLSSQAMH